MVKSRRATRNTAFPQVGAVPSADPVAELADPVTCSVPERGEAVRDVAEPSGFRDPGPFAEPAPRSQDHSGGDESDEEALEDSAGPR